jgi:hypothetical protein
VPATPLNRSVVLVVRAWVEEGRERGFRARLILAELPGGDRAPSAQVVATSVDETISAIRAWLAPLDLDSAGSETMR